MTYAEKLRDPRWQRKRLEIMQRDDFTCCNCGDQSKTLNVDHKVYHRGMEPWDYSDNDLQTLCAPCHKTLTGARQRIAEVVGRMNLFEINQLEAFLDNRTIADEITVVVDAQAFKLPVEWWTDYLNEISEQFLAAQTPERRN